EPDFDWLPVRLRSWIAPAPALLSAAADGDEAAELSLVLPKPRSLSTWSIGLAPAGFSILMVLVLGCRLKSAVNVPASVPVAFTSALKSILAVLVLTVAPKS